MEKIWKYLLPALSAVLFMSCSCSSSRTGCEPSADGESLSCCEPLKGGEPLSDSDSLKGGESFAYMLRPHCELPAVVDSGVAFTGIFLAGTIDMGTGEDWQAGLLDHFSALEGRYVLYNPRQDHWDASLPGEMDYQVNWELEHLEKSDVIIMNFLPGSKSPITLLELGLFARSGKLFVSCPEEFYRYDNVRVTCARYGVPLYGTLDELLRSADVKKACSCVL